MKKAPVRMVASRFVLAVDQLAHNLVAIGGCDIRDPLARHLNEDLTRKLGSA
jgi:hypothetical protein